MTHSLSLKRIAWSKIALGSSLIMGLVSLSGCATDKGASKEPTFVKEADKKAKLSLDRYPMQAQSRNDSLHFRWHTDGLSPNQIKALDQIAEKTAWVKDQPVDLEIISSESSQSIEAGKRIVQYLLSRDVHARDITHLSGTSQPDDVISINTIEYRARIYDCNRTWDNLTKTANNQVYENFGCAVSSNLAAQVANPRAIVSPERATSVDVGRKLTVLSNYREGKLTASESDDTSKGTISDAVE
jgi:pilus assembly protein CpaD